MGSAEQEEKVYLDARMYGMSVHLPDQMLADARFVDDYLRGGKAVEFRRRIYTHRLAEWDLTQEVPKNWFQHLKRQLGLPCKMTTQHATITRLRTFPDIPVLKPSMGVSFLQEERTR